MSTPSSMKGLTQFIIDIRNSQDAQEEKKRINSEINNIQSKFSNSNLNSYQKKKYICKLIYIYLLGYDELVAFGVKESLKLLCAKNLQEKSLGYLSFSILFDHQSDSQYLNDVFNMMYSQLVTDLDIYNDDVNHLALHFIANNFNLPDFTIEINQIENFMDLVNHVYPFAISPMSSVSVKAKSLLCLKNLISLCPEVLTANNNWIPRLISLVDFNNDITIILNSLPVLELIIKLKPSYINHIVPSVVNNLYELVIKNNCDETFQYYKIPSPWLTIKLLQILETCFLGQPDLALTMNPKDLVNLKGIISSSINLSTKGTTSKNIQSAILFQSVSLAIFLDASNESILGAISALMNLLKSTDTNTRYLALDVLIKLIGRSTDKSNIFNDYIFKNLPVVEALLNDKDISIKRKALDLLYIITNDFNYQIIINKLIELFPILEYQLKSELSIKIAILAEKFAKDSTWYVNTMLRLLSVPQSASSTEFLNNEIWERIVQIVINNDELHVKTCKLLINKLTMKDDITDNMIKISCFLIGEYGHLIQKDVPPPAQFQLFYNLYLRSSLITRSMILSTFLKLIHHYPDEDFVANIIDLFEIERESIDLEIQTRSNEYLSLFMLDPKLLNMVRPLPPFETKGNHLLARIGTINKIVGIERVNSLSVGEPLKEEDDGSDVGAGVTSGAAGGGVGAAVGPVSKTTPASETKIILSPNWYEGYHRMLYYNAGVFFENQLVKFFYKIDKIDDSRLSYKLQIINKSYKVDGRSLTSFKILQVKNQSTSVHPSYLVRVVGQSIQQIDDKSSMEVEIKIRDVIDITESPVLSVSFNCGGSFNQLNLKLAVSSLKTITPTEMTLDAFKQRWLQINQLFGKGEHTLNSKPKLSHTSMNITRLMTRLNFAVVFNNESSPDILVLSAGILHSQTNKYGVLVSIKGIDGSDSSRDFEITVKCTGEGIAQVIAVNLQEILKGTA